MVNVPQAMAHALLATVNPVFGIYTLMVAVPIGAIFTSSVYMNVSTTSALSVAAGAGLADIPASQRMEALAVLVLLVGVIQLLAGLFRLGFLIRFVSNAVMTGFLNGVAVLIILGQLGDLTGFQSTFSNNVVRSLDLVLRFGQINVPTTIIGVLTLARIVLLLFTPLRKFAFIIAIVVATVLLALLTLPALATAANFGTVQTVGEVATIPRSLPQLALPRPSLILSMLLPAFSVAMIGLIQGAGVSQGYPNPDGKYPERVAGLPRSGRGQHRHQLRRRSPGRRVDLRHGAAHGRRCQIALGQHLRRVVRGRRSCCWSRRWSSGCPCPRWPPC